jgi:hypothetical protein
MNVGNAEKRTGTPFAGRALSRITVPGIVRFAGNVRIGASGTVKIAIDALTESRCHVNIAETMWKMKTSRMKNFSPHSRNLKPDGRRLQKVSRPLVAQRFPKIARHVQQESERQMNKPIQIRPLSEQETTKLMNTAKFNALHPSCCKSCSNTSDFGRQVFWIGGVRKAEHNSDEIQGLLSYHLKQRYGVESVFFKSVQNKFYVDSAVCKRCASTMIEFDVEFTDDVLAKISQLTATPVEELRSRLEALVEQIAKSERDLPASHDSNSRFKNDKGQTIT